VKVVSPFGEIPWPELSRLSDEEMKVLMVEVVNKTYSFLKMLFTSNPAGLDTVLSGLQQCDMVPFWNEPEYTPLFTLPAA
jgi:hypothetical protein